MGPYQSYSHFCFKNSTATPKKIKNSTAIFGVAVEFLRQYFSVAAEFLRLWFSVAVEFLNRWLRVAVEVLR